MSFGQARWVLVQLNDWTWLVAQYRGWLIALAMVIGGAAPLLSAARKHLPQPSPSLVVRSGAMAVALSAAVGVLNSVVGLPVEWRAAQAAVHTAIACALLAVTAFALMVLTWRRARRAGIRQIVQEEIQKATGGDRLCGTGAGRCGCRCASGDGDDALVMPGSRIASAA